MASRMSWMGWSSGQGMTTMPAVPAQGALVMMAPAMAFPTVSVMTAMSKAMVGATGRAVNLGAVLWRQVFRVRNRGRSYDLRRRLAFVGTA
jgi:hypothetical protein